MSGIYQHFRSEEKEFINQVLTWKESVEQYYSPKLTDFLDPRQQYIVRSIIGKHGEIKSQFFGGMDQTERKRAILYPEYYQPEINDFEISLFEIDYPKKFISLDHRKVLGSLMSLGLKREKFGDIIINKDRIQFFVSKEIDGFVKMHLQQIGRANITLKELPLNEAILPEEVWSEFEASTSSLRLDVILATAFRLSRNKAQALIQQGRTKVNWETIEEPAFDCDEGDVISARGHGRCTIFEVIGKTRKDKLRVRLGIMK